MVREQDDQKRAIIRSVIFTLLFVYVVSYVVLSRRGFKVSDRYDMEGFYFFVPEDTDRWRCAERTVRALYFPLIYLDYWIGTGRWPASEPLWRLSLHRSISVPFARDGLAGPSTGQSDGVGNASYAS